MTNEKFNNLSKTRNPRWISLHQLTEEIKSEIYSKRIWFKKLCHFFFENIWIQPAAGDASSLAH